MRISLIIPTFNRRDYLLECLASVAAQTVAPHEVIIVDDGSCDGTCEAVEGMAGVTLISQPNAGPSAARNRGAAAATGEYLAFLDSDDLWFPWSLAVMEELIRSDRPVLLFGRFVDFTDRLPDNLVMSRAEGRLFQDYLAAAPERVFAGAGMMVIARKAFLDCGGFAQDRLNAEDHDLALRLGTAAGFVQVLAPVTVAHRIHDGNEMRNFGLSIAGLLRMVANERRSIYPGGSARKADRRALIAAHARPLILAALACGELRAALDLYRVTFGWNLRGGRARFLLAVPLLALGAALMSRKTATSQG